MWHDLFLGHLKLSLTRDHQATGCECIDVASPHITEVEASEVHQVNCKMLKIAMVPSTTQSWSKPFSEFETLPVRNQIWVLKVVPTPASVHLEPRRHGFSQVALSNPEKTSQLTSKSLKRDTKGFKKPRGLC